MNAAAMDRRMQVMRAAIVDDGFQQRAGDFAVHGSPIWAERRDMSDGEAQRMGQVVGSLTTRFRVRSSTFSRGITSADQLVCDGVTFEISGIKQTDGRAGLEITATAKVA